MSRRKFRVEVLLEDGCRLAVTRKGAFAILTEHREEHLAYAALAGVEPLTYAHWFGSFRAFDIHSVLAYPELPRELLDKFRAYFRNAMRSDFSRAHLRNRQGYRARAFAPLLPIIEEAMVKHMQRRARQLAAEEQRIRYAELT